MEVEGEKLTEMVFFRFRFCFGIGPTGVTTVLSVSKVESLAGICIVLTSTVSSNMGWSSVGV